MHTFTRSIIGIDHSEATLDGYIIANSPEMDIERHRPAVLILPGGGYEMTSDREADPIAMRMLAYGYQAFVLRYSVLPSQYPVALLETAEVMRLIREHSNEWHIDPTAIVIAGFSAGGHLAATIGTSGSDDILYAHGYSKNEVQPNGMMLAYPVITSGEYAHRGSFNALLGEQADNPSMLRRVSLEHHVTNSTPPTFIWHTTTDTDVPVQNTMMFIDALLSHHIPVEAHIFPFGEHGLALANYETMRPDGSGIVNGASQWIDLFQNWMSHTFPASVPIATPHLSK